LAAAEQDYHLAIAKGVINPVAPTNKNAQFRHSAADAFVVPQVANSYAGDAKGQGLFRLPILQLANPFVEFSGGVDFVFHR
jgi:hypothetical protein